MNTINELLQSEMLRIRELGQKAVQYKGMMDRDEISNAEYQRLRDQLTHLHELDLAAATAEERQALAEAVAFLKTWLPVVL